MKVLVTGASGFVGVPLVSHLDSLGHQVIKVVRATSTQISESPEEIVKSVHNIDIDTNWSDCLPGVDVVIHLANRAHVMNEQEENPLGIYRKINAEGTLNLARQAAAAGVKRFIFISSVKVNGESTLPGKSFKANDSFVPTDPYGLSKYEAEIGLKKISEETGLEVVIIRPPLIYGPGVKANFLKMMQWIDRGIPLPFGSIHNQRSLIGVDNLLDFIVVCLNHPNAAGKTFLVSDNHDLSTTELLRKIAHAMGKPSRLIPVPQAILSFLLIFLGQRRIAERLCSSLQLDIQYTKEQLGWQPPYSVEDQLIKTSKAYQLKNLTR